MKEQSKRNKESIVFLIIDANGNPVMRTDSVSCIPPDHQLLSMESIGYKFKYDGKIVSRRKIAELRAK